MLILRNLPHGRRSLARSSMPTKPLRVIEDTDVNMQNFINRRTFLNRSTVGIGSVVLASQMLTGRHADAASGGNIRPHFPAKAKRVIFLCMAGGPSHLETLDYKPKLAEMDGQPMPASITDGQPIAQLQGKELKCLAPAVQVSQAWRVRSGDLGDFSAHRQDRRRHRYCSLDDDAADQPRSRTHVHELRDANLGSTLHGILDSVRTRK